MDCLYQMLDEEVYKTVSALMDPEKSLRENISALYDFTCNLAYNNYEAYRRIFASSRIEGNSYTRSMWLKMFGEWLTAAAKNGEIGVENIDMKARCLLSYILGYNLLFFEINKTDLETSLSEKDAAVNVILNGLLNS